MADGEGLTFRARCTTCGEPQASAKPHEVGYTYAGPCPRCRGSDVHLEMRANEVVGLVDELRYRGKDLETRRTVKGRITREMTEGGPTAGTLASVEQMVDKINRRYRKKVTLSDGTVSKDVDGPLGDQSLHGARGGSPKE